VTVEKGKELHLAGKGISSQTMVKKSRKVPKEK